MNRSSHDSTDRIMRQVPPGPPISNGYRVPEGHPCYGCRMFANPCYYPCNRFREKKIDRTADEIIL